MILSEMYQNIPVVMTFGRFNPPTIAHEYLITAGKKLADRIDGRFFVFPSKTEGNTKNPLPFLEKLKVLRTCFPYTDFVVHESIRDPFGALRWLDDQGYRDVRMIVGQDRADQFEDVKKYIGHTDPSKRYNFDQFGIVNAGKRNGRTGISSISSSKARECVGNNDFDSFANMMPTNCDKKTCRHIFHTVRSNLDHMAFSK